MKNSSILVVDMATLGTGLARFFLFIFVEKEKKKATYTATQLYHILPDIERMQIYVKKMVLSNCG